VIYPSHFGRILSLDGLDLEMQCNQGEHQRLQILDKIVENTEAFGILRLCDINQGAYFGSLSTSMISMGPGFWIFGSYLKWDMLAAHPNF
jgi:hypothetical protein